MIYKLKNSHQIRSEFSANLTMVFPGWPILQTIHASMNMKKLFTSSQKQITLRLEHDKKGDWFTIFFVFCRFLFRLVDLLSFEMFVLNYEQQSEASTFTAQAANVSLEWTENFLLETQVSME